MSDQLAFDTPAPPSHRVEALAGILAGFFAPGSDSWSTVPKPVKTACRAVAEEMLVTAEARIAALERK
jgi:hypothetical protein